MSCLDGLVAKASAQREHDGENGADDKERLERREVRLPAPVDVVANHVSRAGKEVPDGA